MRSLILTIILIFSFNCYAEEGFVKVDSYKLRFEYKAYFDSQNKHIIFKKGEEVIVDRVVDSLGKLRVKVVIGEYYLYMPISKFEFLVEKA